jgi:beta-mannosidase
MDFQTLHTAAQPTPAVLTVDLGGAWTLTQVGQGDPLPAQVPGCVHTDLLAAHKIADPYFRTNEGDVQWVSEVDWEYSRTFTAAAELLAHPRVLLRCEGLDTLATLILNGHEIARTENMFRTWEFDVTAHLVPGDNTLTVRFASPNVFIREKQAERNVPSWGGPNEIRGRAWLRKEPCNFGWDWGPILATCGIWRPMRLVAYSARLTDLHITQDHATAGQVALAVAARAEALGDPTLTLNIRVTLDGAPITEAWVPVTDGTAQAHLTVADPQLWWPNGMGAQPLYTVSAELRAADGTVVDRTHRRIGLRTLRLDRHPDQWGESFQFTVNGVPFFAKGGNWIPADAFATRVTPDRYRDLVDSVARANMNMLRVWGGGTYEEDYFYDLCDERGICIWQDFMFACSTYPAFDEGFLATVRAEAEDNIRRLRHHAGLALWCGNNELEQGLVGESPDHQMSWADYGTLFDQLLPEVIATLDPEHDYWPGSPHTPIGDRTNFNDPTCGDAHLWDVWHGRQPFEWYRTCEHRFNSEFGFQSFPEPRTVETYTLPGDRNITSFVMEHHQRSGIGNTVIMQYMLDWFLLPTRFEMSLWLSQILHGMAMKYAVEHWRRQMPRGMGTLYWQINDCWPVASWASIDYFGRWKACQYMARHFFNPLLVSGVENLTAGTVELHVTSDLQSCRSGVLTWALTDTRGTTLLGGQQSLCVQPLQNSLVETLDLSEALRAYGARNLLLWLALEVEGQVVSTDLVTFCRPKHLTLEAPTIAVDVQESAAGVHVTLATDVPALWAWLELEGIEAKFSESFVHLRPGHPITLTVTPATPQTAAAIAAVLRVQSLTDTHAVAATQEMGGGPNSLHRHLAP